MESAYFMLYFYGAIAIISVPFLVYFIVKRIKSKKKEVFEKRKN